MPTTPAASTPQSAVEEVRRLDIAQRREEAMVILKLIPAETLRAKHAERFYKNIVNTNPSNSQQLRGMCMNCSTTVSSTGSARFAVHLSTCSMAPRDVRDAFKALQHEKEKKSSAKREAVVLAIEEEDEAAKDHRAAQAVLKQQCIRAGIKGHEAAAADAAIANFFYVNGISLAAADSEATSLYRTMVRAIQNTPSTRAAPCTRDPGRQRQMRGRA